MCFVLVGCFKISSALNDGSVMFVTGRGESVTDPQGGPSDEKLRVCFLNTTPVIVCC